MLTPEIGKIIIAKEYGKNWAKDSVNIHPAQNWGQEKRKKD